MRAPKGIAFIIGLSLLAFVWIFSGSPMNVTVRVIYTNGKPVEGAAVVVVDFLSGKTHVAVTDSTGTAKFSIPNFDKKWFGMTIEKDGEKFPVEYDVVRDGVIDMKDIVYFAKKFGSDTAAIGSVRVIVPPKYDKTLLISASPYPEQLIIFADVPPPSTPVPTPPPTPTPPLGLMSLLTPPTLYLTIGVTALFIGLLYVAVKPKPR